MLKGKGKFKTSQKGSALITVLLLLLIFAVLASSVLLTSTNNMYVSRQMSDYEDLYYIAEAGVQYSMDFIKEQVSLHYTDFYDEVSIQDNTFLTDLSEAVRTDSTSSRFVPLSYSDHGVDLTTTIEQVPNVITITGEKEANQVMTFEITCVATEDNPDGENISRTVYGEISISNPLAIIQEITTPPTLSARVAAGGSIADNPNSSTDNIFIPYSDIMVGVSYPDEYDDWLNNDHFDDYNFEVNPYTPNLLQWELEYDKFPVHEAFETYEALYDAYSSDADSRYVIPKCIYCNRGCCQRQQERNWSVS